MKQYNDVVLFVKGGVKTPAFVLRSNVQEDGEHLALLFADPVNGPTLIGAGQYKTVAQVVFDVRPYREGSVNHWEEIDDKAKIEVLSGLLLNADKEITHLRSLLLSVPIGGTPGSPAPDGGTYGEGHPSSADLDTVAAEEKAKEDTTEAPTGAPPAPPAETPAQ